HEVYKIHYINKQTMLILSREFNQSDQRRLYELCHEVVNMAKKLKVNTLYSIGAALRPPHPTEPKLFGITSSPKLVNLIKKQKIELLNGKGQITGFNGLVLGIAKEKNLESI